jgi:RNA polymerase sigma-70 factor (ECF subfamily)
MSAGGEPRGTEQLKAELDSLFRLPLMAYFSRRVGSRSEAEDLTQETFARLIGAHSFTQPKKADAYVFRVASNLLRDRNRSGARWKKYLVSPIDPVRAEEIYDLSEDPSPERVLMGRERLAEVLRALDELGERTRNVFILFRVERMKQKDIALLYGIGVSTVEKDVMAAVLHLAERFGQRTP